MKLINRLTDVITKDRQVNPQYIKDIIKSDLYYLLNNYFEIEHENIQVDINLIDSATYKIDISASGTKMKVMQIIPR